MQNPNKNTYDQIAKSYHAHRTSKVLWRTEIEDFASKMPTGAEIVDLGCGAGSETAWLAENIKGSHITGVDFSGEMIGIAKEDALKNTEYLVGNIPEYHHPNPVDGVWARGSLHHLNQEELRDTLVQVGTYLKPAGLLCCINKYGKGEQVETTKYYGDPVERYFNYFTEGILENLIGPSGLTLVSEEVHTDDAGFPYLVSYLRRDA